MVSNLVARSTGISDGLGALENLIDECRRTSEHVEVVHSVSHQAWLGLGATARGSEMAVEDEPDLLRVDEPPAQLVRCGF
jgi:hypothetical protein